MLKKAIHRTIHITYLIIKVNWIKLFIFHSKKSNNIIWIFPSYPSNFYAYIAGNDLLNDLALIQSFISEGLSFKIKYGPKIGDLSKKNIFYTISRWFNIYNLSNHSSTMLNVISELTKQNNILFPSLEEAKYWENKSHMHIKFNELNINSPKTWIIKNNKELTNIIDDVKFPCLIKECNSSGSAGIYKVHNYSELDNLIKSKNNEGEYEILVQSLINMKKDLRVIFVDKEIVLHYWRINEEKEWKPTSTGFGSKVDFDSFPDFWLDEILKIIRSLNLRTGAFDICWDDDDTSNTPIILEVSPSYQPNPKLPLKWRNIKYSQFKSKLTYYVEYINIVFTIKHKLVKLYLKEIK